ncbi:MAG: membrane protein insertase YidC [Desulfoferrobacter sp.]
MEKRALIAFVLSLAVLLFWELYFGGLYRTPPTQTKEQTQTVSPPPEPTQTETPSKLLPETLPKDRLSVSDRSFQSWLVDTNVYEMKILAPGARLDSFKLKDYRQQVAPTSPPMDMVTTQTSGYLPLAVDLVHHSNLELGTRPFESQAPELIKLPSSAESQQPISFSTTVPGQVKLTKTLSPVPGTYIVDAAIRIENLSSEKLQDQLGISFYFEPYEKANETSYNKSQLTLLKNGSLEYHQAKDLRKKEFIFDPPMDWIGYENNYFIQAIIPMEKEGYKLVPRVLDENKGLIQLVYLTNPFELSAGEAKTYKLRLYLGPKDVETLGKAGHDLARAVDFGWFTFLAKPLLLVLRWFYKYTHNYGIAIILLTVVIKIIFWPLTQKSYKSMQVMKKIQPKIAQVREKYKDDREKLNQELMMLYRTYKVNPLGGCLPMVLQIPVFFALYRMLYGALELRHKPFMLWINDLTAPDRLHIGIDIPYLGGIPVLTLLMGVSMFIQQKMTPSGGDPRQEKMMLLMPVIFTVFFINFPSGLVLYWLVNNVLSIVQQYWINRSA